LNEIKSLTDVAPSGVRLATEEDVVGLDLADRQLLRLPYAQWSVFLNDVVAVAGIGEDMARFLRYMLRALLVVLLLLDVKLFITLVFPIEDRQVPTAVEWPLVLLTIGLLLGVQTFIVWLDVRIGRKTRSISG
jgi:hypothetical protein